MSNTKEIKERVFAAILDLLEDKKIQIADGTPLLGDGSLLDSMRVVELCLNLEDIAAEIGFEFDWTSAAAMSKTRSMFRTAGALATEFQTQMESKK